MTPTTLKPNIIDVSIDLETLALTRDAVILTIGIVDTQGTTISIAPSVSAQATAGRAIDDGTLQWWWAQGDNARGALLGTTVNLADARAQVARYFNGLKGHDYRVWGNAPSFDCDILGHFMGGKCWGWYHERCVRTAREILGQRTRPTTAHCAISDAAAQLEDVRLYRLLAGKAALVEEAKEGQS